jgi:hypothetical protein
MVPKLTEQVFGGSGSSSFPLFPNLHAVASRGVFQVRRR